MNSRLELLIGQLAYLQEPFLLDFELAEHEAAFLLFASTETESEILSKSSAMASEN